MTDTTLPRPTQAAWLSGALWLGLAAGWCELLLIGWSVLRPQSPWPGFLRTNPHRLWLTPLASAVYVGGFGFAVAILERLLRGRLSARLLWTLITVPACLGAAFYFRSQVDGRALFLLAAGAGYQLAGPIASRADGFARLARRTTPWLLAATAVVAVGVGVRQTTGDRVASTGPTAPASAPNVLLVVMDTVRQSDVEYAEGTTRTPTIARLARAGTRFDAAISASSWTLPSHGTIFTGHLPSEIFRRGETPLNASTPLPADFPTLAESLRGRGYLTAGFVANTVYGSREHGLQRGFAHYEDYALTVDAALGSTSLLNFAYGKVRRVLGNPNSIDRKSATDVSSAFLAWVDGKSERPFFAFLNYFDAHDPYVPPGRFRPEAADRIASPAIDPFRVYKSGQVETLRTIYRGCVAYVDDEIGRVLAGLADRGLLQNTLVVVTSDHGEHFGEHTLMSHGNSLYRPLLAVPLVFVLPSKVPANVVVRTPISLRDVPATVLETIAASDGRFPGASLSRFWSSPTDEATRGGPILAEEMIGAEKHKWAPERWPVSRGALVSAIAEGYHYIRDGSGREELYDFTADVDEAHDLAGTDAGPAVLARFRLLTRGDRASR